MCVCMYVFFVGVTKGGKGKVLLNSHVESIVVENGRATGVQLRGSRKRILKARRAVIQS